MPTDRGTRSSSLTIYRGNYVTGTLTVGSSSGGGISGDGSLIVNSGTVNATGDTFGIKASNYSDTETLTLYKLAR